MQFMSQVFSNTTSLMTSVCMRYVGADKLLKGDQSICSHVELDKMVIRCRATDIATFTHMCNENWIISPLPVKDQFGGL